MGAAKGDTVTFENIQDINGTFTSAFTGGGNTLDFNANLQASHPGGAASPASTAASSAAAIASSASARTAREPTGTKPSARSARWPRCRRPRRA